MRMFNVIKSLAAAAMFALASCLGNGGVEETPVTLPAEDTALGKLSVSAEYNPLLNDKLLTVTLKDGDATVAFADIKEQGSVLPAASDFTALMHNTAQHVEDEVTPSSLEVKDGVLYLNFDESLATLYPAADAVLLSYKSSAYTFLTSDGRILPRFNGEAVNYNTSGVPIEGAFNAVELNVKVVGEYVDEENSAVDVDMLLDAKVSLLLSSNYDFVFTNTGTDYLIKTIWRIPAVGDVVDNTATLAQSVFSTFETGTYAVELRSVYEQPVYYERADGKKIYAVEISDGEDKGKWQMVLPLYIKFLPIILEADFKVYTDEAFQDELLQNEQSVYELEVGKPYYLRDMTKGFPNKYEWSVGSMSADVLTPLASTDYEIVGADKESAQLIMKTAKENIVIYHKADDAAAQIIGRENQAKAYAMKSVLSSTASDFDVTIGADGVMTLSLLGDDTFEDKDAVESSTSQYHTRFVARVPFADGEDMILYSSNVAISDDATQMTISFGDNRFYAGESVTLMYDDESQYNIYTGKITSSALQLATSGSKFLLAGVDKGVENLAVALAPEVEIVVNKDGDEKVVPVNTLKEGSIGIALNGDIGELKILSRVKTGTEQVLVDAVWSNPDNPSGVDMLSYQNINGEFTFDDISFEAYTTRFQAGIYGSIYMRTAEEQERGVDRMAMLSKSLEINVLTETLTVNNQIIATNAFGVERTPVDVTPTEDESYDYEIAAGESLTIKSLALYVDATYAITGSNDGVKLVQDKENNAASLTFSKIGEYQITQTLNRPTFEDLFGASLAEAEVVKVINVTVTANNPLSTMVKALNAGQIEVTVDPGVNFGTYTTEQLEAVKSDFKVTYDEVGTSELEIKSLTILNKNRLIISLNVAKPVAADQVYDKTYSVRDKNRMFSDDVIRVSYTPSSAEAQITTTDIFGRKLDAFADVQIDVPNHRYTDNPYFDLTADDYVDGFRFPFFTTNQLLANHSGWAFGPAASLYPSAAIDGLFVVNDPVGGDDKTLKFKVQNINTTNFAVFQCGSILEMPLDAEYYLTFDFYVDSRYTEAGQTGKEFVSTAGKDSKVSDDLKVYFAPEGEARASTLTGMSSKMNFSAQPMDVWLSYPTDSRIVGTQTPIITNIHYEEDQLNRRLTMSVTLLTGQVYFKNIELDMYLRRANFVEAVE